MSGLVCTRYIKDPMICRYTVGSSGSEPVTWSWSFFKLEIICVLMYLQFILPKLRSTSITYEPCERDISPDFCQNFKLSNVKDPSLSFQNSLLVWAITILSFKKQMKILNHLHIRMIKKKISHRAPRVIIHEVLFMDSFLFHFTDKTSLTSVRWSIQNKKVTKGSWWR